MIRGPKQLVMSVPCPNCPKCPAPQLTATPAPKEGEDEDAMDDDDELKELNEEDEEDANVDGVEPSVNAKTCRRPLDIRTMRSGSREGWMVR